MPKQEQLVKEFEHLLRLNAVEPGRLNNFLETHLPIAEWLQEKLAEQPGFLLGINGAQGSGKSTFVQFILTAQQVLYGRKGIALSIDDLYLTRAERQHLAEEIHPLLATRGVPGTHDLALGKQLVNQLRQAGVSEKTAIVRFNKAEDDRYRPDHWHLFQGRPDFIILEGWCVGSTAQPAHDLTLPVNELEENEDTEGTWRHYVNEQLETTYKDFFSMLEGLIFLQVPSFEKVFEWRCLQEQKLAESNSGSKIMSPGEIKRFIQHYERITLNNLKTLPEISDFIVTLDDEHVMKTYQVR